MCSKAKQNRPDSARAAPAIGAPVGGEAPRTGASLGRGKALDSIHELPEPPSDDVPKRMETSGVSGPAVEHAHALRAPDLPHYHRDPCDRLQLAQAQVQSLPILTADLWLARYV